MIRAKYLVSQFVADQRGATAIEYALISLLVAVPVVASYLTLGGNLSSKISAVAAAFK
jgi:Flp pilus assembly pilin Flp